MGLLTIITVFVLGLIVFHTLERFAPIQVHASSPPGRRGYVADLTAALLDGPILSAATKISAYGLIMLVPQAWNLIGGWSWILQFGVFFLVNDFARYWLHRWYHEIPLLWRFHRVHHSVREMDAMSTFRVHFFEAVIKYGVLILPFRLLGINEWVITLYSCLDITKGLWHHANLRTRIGKFNYFLNSAEQHWWHHAIEWGERNVNYGSILSIWDRAFGTFHYRPGQWPAEIGVRGIEHFPSTYHEQFVSILHDDEAARRQYGAAPNSPDHSASMDQKRAMADSRLDAGESVPA